MHVTTILLNLLDINEDGVICQDDLDHILDLLTDSRLLKSEKKGIIERVGLDS